MPLALSNGMPLEDWLIGRAIDRHRPNGRILKKLLGIRDTGDLASVLHVHAAAITDDYWLRADTEPDLAYRDIQYTENYFSEVALRGRFSSYGTELTPEQSFGKAPDLTTVGSYEKCWRLENSAWYMHKQGSALERFSELFIAALGTELGFAMAAYERTDDHIKTKDFTGGTLNFEPAAALVGDDEDYELNYDRIEALGPRLTAQYLDILYMDALCFNMDRHTYNYGFLRDRNTGRVLSMAPNFDNNIALISRGYTGEARHTNGLLIKLFLELLEARSITYQAPPLEAEQLERIAEQTLPDESIDRQYVITMVADRYERLNTGLQALAQKQNNAPQQTL